MAKFLATIKAIITRLVFAAHGFIGIWQVTIFKKNSFYWYLSSPILLLFFEGIFTLTIKENQEWKWYENLFNKSNLKLTIFVNLVFFVII